MTLSKQEVTVPGLLPLVLATSMAAGEVASVPPGVDAAPGVIALTGRGTISLAQERLTVGPEFQVEIESTFENGGDAAVVADLAFPVPDYGYDPLFSSSAIRDVRVWVGDREVRAPLEVFGVLRTGDGERDVTAEVRCAGLSVETLGGVNEPVRVGADGTSFVDEKRWPLQALAAAARQRLLERGVVEAEYGALVPNWIVRSRYRWTQEFPARSTVRVRVRYGGATRHEGQGRPSTFASRCGKAPSVATGDANEDMDAYAVAFAPGSPRGWKGPIGSFELVLVKPKSGLASLCWDGKVSDSGAALSVRGKNFAPQHNVQVYLFVPLAGPPE